MEEKAISKLGSIGLLSMVLVFTISTLLTRSIAFALLSGTYLFMYFSSIIEQKIEISKTIKEIKK